MWVWFHRRFCNASLVFDGSNSISVRIERSKRVWTRGDDSGGSGSTAGLGTLTTQATTLALGETAPDSELLTVHQGVLEALETNCATTAHFFGFTGGCSTLWEEEVGVDTETVRVVLPVLFVLAHGSLPIPTRRPLHLAGFPRRAGTTSVSFWLMEPSLRKGKVGKSPACGLARSARRPVACASDERSNIEMAIFPRFLYIIPAQRP